MNPDEYLTKRIDDQIDWYDHKAIDLQRMNVRLQTLILTLSLLLPIILSIPKNLGGIDISSTINAGTTIMSIVLAIFIAFQSYRNYREKWIEYRTTAESLKNEKYMYLTKSGKYRDSEHASEALLETIEKGLIQQRMHINKIRNDIMDIETISLPEEFYLTSLLASKIREKDINPNVIVAICPGGAMIAEWLSQRFIGNSKEPIRMASLWVESKRYTDRVFKIEGFVDEKQHAFFPELTKNTKILLVLDVSRSGRTLEAAHEFLLRFVPKENIISACLYCHMDIDLDVITITKKAKPSVFEWKTSPVQ